MKIVTNRKFAWVALVFALVLVIGPVAAPSDPVSLYPWPNCPPAC